MPSLEGKRALITGGSRGIGAEVAKQLAERGVRIAINYVGAQDRAEQTRASLKGDGHVLVQGDAFTHEGLAQIVKGAREGLGGLDIVISNAGWTQFGAFNDLESVSDDDWIRCYQTNVMSHLWLMQEVKDELIANKGSFVISASVAGLKPSGSSMAYSVSKAGTVHLAKSLAKACAPARVNAVAAGVMLTEWSKGFTEEHVEKVKQTNALNMICEVEDVASQYVSLCENKSITGQIIEVSAGFQL